MAAFNAVAFDPIDEGCGTGNRRKSGSMPSMSTTTDATYPTINSPRLTSAAQVKSAARRSHCSFIWPLVVVAESLQPSRAFGRLEPSHFVPQDSAVVLLQLINAGEIRQIGLHGYILP